MDVLWLEQRLADVPSDDEWLSEREKQKAASLKFAKRRADWRLGRWTAKLAVAAKLGNRELSQIEIIAGANGAPAVFLRGERARLAISISHRAGVGACVVAEKGAIGCDLEIVEERSDAFVRDYFTAEEKLALSYSKETMRLAAVMWSAKESALKALGEGLRMDTRSVVVSDVCGYGREWSPLRVRCDTGEVFAGWWTEVDGMVRTMVSEPAGVPQEFTTNDTKEHEEKQVELTSDE